MYVQVRFYNPIIYGEMWDFFSKFMNFRILAEGLWTLFTSVMATLNNPFFLNYSMLSLQMFFCPPLEREKHYIVLMNHKCVTLSLISVYIHWL